MTDPTKSVDNWGRIIPENHGIKSIGKGVLVTAVAAAAIAALIVSGSYLYGSLHHMGLNQLLNSDGCLPIWIFAEAVAMPVVALLATTHFYSQSPATEVETDLQGPSAADAPSGPAEQKDRVRSSPRADTPKVSPAAERRGLPRARELIDEWRKEVHAAQEPVARPSDHAECQEDNDFQPAAAQNMPIDEVRELGAAPGVPLFEAFDEGNRVWVPAKDSPILVPLYEEFDAGNRMWVPAEGPILSISVDGLAEGDPTIDDSFDDSEDGDETPDWRKTSRRL